MIRTMKNQRKKLGAKRNRNLMKIAMYVFSQGKLYRILLNLCVDTVLN